MLTPRPTIALLKNVTTVSCLAVILYGTLLFSPGEAHARPGSAIAFSGGDLTALWVRIQGYENGRRTWTKDDFEGLIRKHADRILSHHPMSSDRRAREAVVSSMLAHTYALKGVKKYAEGPKRTGFLQSILRILTTPRRYENALAAFLGIEGLQPIRPKPKRTSNQTAEHRAHLAFRRMVSPLPTTMVVPATPMDLENVENGYASGSCSSTRIL